MFEAHFLAMTLNSGLDTIISLLRLVCQVPSSSVVEYPNAIPASSAFPMTTAI